MLCPKGFRGYDAVASNSALVHARLLARDSQESVERRAMTVGYAFSSASPLVMRVRQVVFASVLAFCKLGVCPGQDGARKRGCRRASCHDRDRLNSQTTQMSRHHSKDPTKHALC